MWKRMAVAAAATMGLAACGMPWEEHGNGTKVTEVRELTGFDQVQNATQLEVNVRFGETPKVEVTVDENLQELIEVGVNVDTLMVMTAAPIHYTGEGRVDVVLPRLVGAVLTGSGTLHVEGRQQPEDLKVHSPGSGTLTLCTDMRSLEGTHDGSGDMSLCVPDGGERLTHLKLTTRGSGKTTWRGEAEEAEVVHEGSGEMHLAGSSEQLTLTQSGSGPVDARELSARLGTFTSRSSGDVTATVSEAATVSLSGSGNIDLRGGAEVDIVSDTGSGEVIVR